MADKKFKGGVLIESTLQVDSSLSLPALTGSRVLQLGAGGAIESSAVTDTQLGYLSTLSSDVQTQLDAKLDDFSSSNDNRLVRTDGTAGDAIQESPVILTDAGAMSGIASIETTGNVTVGGDLTVNGTTTTINTTTLEVTDANILVNNGGNQASANSSGAGITVEMSDATDAVISYDSSLASKFKIGESGSEAEIADVSSSQTLTNKTINAASNTISNIDTTMLAAGVLDTDISTVSASHDTLASALAIKTYVDGIDSDTKQVLVSANDTTEGYLEDKIVGASGKIAISTLNDAGDEDLQITIGADVFDKTVDDSDDIVEGATNLFYTDERAQDSVGSILLDTASIDFTYDDVTPNISAVVLPAGVDHDALANFVANEHIDHSAVVLTAGDGLSGGGDITASRSFAVDINGSTDKASPVAGDELLIADSEAASAIKKVDIGSIAGALDHDSLSGFVANEHVDHSGVEIQTAADSGLSGGGDITASRSLSVDISGTTAETSADNADLILIHDDSAGVLKSMSRSNFLSGIALTSAGDIAETSFAGANNQATPANVTGLAFANGTVRSFEAQVSVVIDATADLYEVFKLHGIQKGASWDMSVESTGDDSQVAFSITSAGQVQYTSPDSAGFVSLTMKFRAETTSV